MRIPVRQEDEICRKIVIPTTCNRFLLKFYYNLGKAPAVALPPLLRRDQSSELSKENPIDLTPDDWTKWEKIQSSGLFVLAAGSRQKMEAFVTSFRQESIIRFYNTDEKAVVIRFLRTESKLVISNKVPDHHHPDGNDLGQIKIQFLSFG